MTLDQRTRAMLVANGTLTPTGLTVKARHLHCPRGCGLVLLACQWLGFEFWCDPWPLTVRGELEALLAGRTTFTRGTYTDGLRLRQRWDIAVKSPDRHDVHAEHLCGHPHHEVNHARIRPERATSRYDAPPF